MEIFVLIRTGSYHADQYAAQLNEPPSLAAVQRRALELLARLLRPRSGVAIAGIVGVVRAADKISAGLATTEPDRILWISTICDVSISSMFTLIPDADGAIERWAREPPPAPPDRAQVMALPPGSVERARLAKIWLLALCARTSSATQHEPDPGFLSAIHELPEMWIARRLAPEFRAVIEEAVGMSSSDIGAST